MATTTIKIKTDRSGVFSTIPDATACPSCGCEPEITNYYVKKMRRTSDGTEISVRVGYRCTCTAVVIDGLVTMMM